MKKIFPDYIRELDYYLGSMSDDDLADFFINDSDCRARLFEAMMLDFDRLGPLSKQRVLEAIEFILSSGQIDKLWGYVVPHAVPLDEVEDESGYLRTLYEKLAGREPQPRNFGVEVELVDAIGPNGIDVRQ